MTPTTNVLHLSDDILVDVLGWLPALDVLRCRRVCRRFYSISKIHSVWSSVYRGTTCLLPHKDDLDFNKLEKALQQAETMEQIWTGVQPNHPELQPLITNSLPVPSTCVGMADQYAVFLTHKFLDAPTYRWYKVMPHTGNLDPAFEYKIGPSEGESPHKIIWHGHHIEAGTGTVNIAAIHESDLEGYRLQVVEATVRQCSGVTLEIVVKPSIQLDCLADIPKKRIFGILNSDFIQLRYANGNNDTVGEGRLLLVQMRTGKLISSPPHNIFSPLSNSLSFMHKRLEIFVTPSYIIQVVQGELFEFFKLPAGWDGPESPESVSSEKSFLAGSFPLQFLAIWRIYPSSPTEYIVLGLSSPTSDLATIPSSSREDHSRAVLLTIDIGTGSAMITRTKTWSYGVLAEVSHFQLSPNYYPTPSSSMGVLVLRTPSHELYHLMVQIVFAGPDPEDLSLTFTKIDMPDELVKVNDKNSSFFYLWTDPFNGRLVGQSFKFYPTRSTIYIINLLRKYAA